MACRMLSLVLRRKTVHSSPFFRLNPPYNKVGLSTASFFHRLTSSVRNDPFVKLSVSLCALIAGGTLVMELYNRLKKKSSPSVHMLPPGFGHHSVRRESVLAELHNKILKDKSKELPPVVYVTGSPGSGKTEVIRQFSNEYGRKKWLGLRSVPAVVITIEATSQKTLQLSLHEATNRLGLQPSSSSESMLLAILSQLISKDLPWLLVFDNLTETTEFFLENLLEKCSLECLPSQSSGAVLITTSIPLRHNKCTLQVPQRFDVFIDWSSFIDIIYCH